MLLWDILSRRWQQWKNVQNIGLLVADKGQVGGEVGPIYDVIISRTPDVSAQAKVKARIVACGVSLANAYDLGEWISALSRTIFNFCGQLHYRSDRRRQLS
jgi:pre-mRNA-splicing helicase BRR2